MPLPTRSKPQEAIIVLGSSFCPPHAGHVAALDAGKRRAESDGLTVTAGYFAVATNRHVYGKLSACRSGPILFAQLNIRVLIIHLLELIVQVLHDMIAAAHT